MRTPTAAVRLALLVLVLALAGLAGCGGSGGNGGADARGYIREVGAAQSDFIAAARRLDLVNPSSPAGFGRSLTALGRAIDRVVERLDRLRPPEAVRAEHAQLVGSLRTYGDALARERGGLSSQDKARVQSAARKIGAASRAFSATFGRAINAINAKLRTKTS